MSSEEVSTSSSGDGKKSSKPIMEKRRRARINASLVELKSLLMDVIKSEGAIHSKMEKADILEMTVRHLRSLQTQHFPENVGLRRDKPGKFSLGYTECISEVGKFLNSLEIEEIDLKTKVIDHLANCVTRLRPSDVEMEMMTSPAGLGSRSVSSFCSPGPIQVVPPTLVVSAQTKEDTRNLVSQTADTCNRSTSGVSGSNMQYFMKGDQLQYKSTSDTVSNLSTVQGLNLSTRKPTCETGHGNAACFNVSSSCAVPSTEAQIRYTSKSTVQSSQQNPPVINQPNILNLQTMQVSHTPLAHPGVSDSPIPSHLFSGLQIVPTTLSGNEVAFVVPANILSTSGNVFATMAAPSYVLPVYKMEVGSSGQAKSDPPAPTQVSAVTTSHVTGSESLVTSPVANKSAKYKPQAIEPVTKHDSLHAHAHTYQPYDLSKRSLHSQSSSMQNNSGALTDTRSNGIPRRTHCANGSSKEAREYLKPKYTPLVKCDNDAPKSSDGRHLLNTAQGNSSSCSNVAEGKENNGDRSPDANQSEDMWRPW